MHLTMSSFAPQLMHGSPLVTSRRSAHRSTARSRSTAPPVPTVLVGSGGHVEPAAQRLVGDDMQARDVDGAETARLGAERCDGLGLLRRADVDRPGRVLELLQVELVVAPEAHERDRTVEHHDQRLDLVDRAGTALELGERSDGDDARGGELLELVGAVLRCDVGERGGGSLDVGPVVAVRAHGDVVLAGG